MCPNACCDNHSDIVCCKWIYITNGTFESDLLVHKMPRVCSIQLTRVTSTLSLAEQSLYFASNGPTFMAFTHNPSCGLLYLILWDNYFPQKQFRHVRLRIHYNDVLLGTVQASEAKTQNEVKTRAILFCFSSIPASLPNILLLLRINVSPESKSRAHWSAERSSS